MRTTAVLMAMSLAVGGCHRAKTNSPAPSVTVQPADTTVEGVVRVVGSMPFSHAVVRGVGGDVAVSGPLAGELAALSGAEVRVVGTATAAAPPPPTRAVNVTSYTVLQVNGETPFVGVLVSRDGALWLAGKDTLALTGVPADFGATAGDKVFILGRQTDGKLSVLSYGVIKRAK